ncbi:MAG: uroporphyrinogen-III synthase [Bacteroidetes bacterium]|nr:uroporphyrinogen-III synthase [Bacteroidota bacterium]
MKILISQPPPDMEKSPYSELIRKYNVELTFHPFIKLEPISAKEIRRQKIDISAFSAILFTSRNAIDHFFRCCEELKIIMPLETKYFCITEAVALYLQKFITYRKRKAFFGLDGTNDSFFECMDKFKQTETFLYVCSENQQDNEIVNWLKNHQCDFQLGFMYRSVNNDLSEVMGKTKYDVICLFTPSGVYSLLENYPAFSKNGTTMAGFGNNTIKCLENAGFKVTIKAPLPLVPSMISALDIFCEATLKKTT